MKTVTVGLKQRSYDILIGKNSLQNLPKFLTEKSYSKIFIITDENVARHHLSSLQAVVVNSESIILAAGEQTKSFATLQKVCEEILAKGVDRKSLIIAFGGGVIGDLAGFIASILLRGIDFVQIPTTLLAAVDSSVGGKTAVNSVHGKNLIGSFYQPKMVLCDLNFLTTLSQRELRSGYAEVLKYGLVFDENFLQFLEKDFAKIFTFDEEFLTKIIARSCEIKAQVVASDEREQGVRALLNFGHTFGHIFETEVNYSDEILHGEAVALGMLMAAKMSQDYGQITEQDFLRIKAHLENCGFMLDLKKIRRDWDEKNLVTHLYKDKKNEGKNLTFILLKAVGLAEIKKSVPLEDFLKILRKFV